MEQSGMDHFEFVFCVAGIALGYAFSFFMLLYMIIGLAVDHGKAEGQKEMFELQREAVAKSKADWIMDEEGNAKFKWKESK